MEYKYDAVVFMISPGYGLMMIASRLENNKHITIGQIVVEFDLQDKDTLYRVMGGYDGC